ncbi:hypothetical protein OKW50_006397 [Paraburkholderia youngii]
MLMASAAFLVHRQESQTAKPITILAGSSCCCRANSFEGGESHFDKLLLTSGSVATLFAQNHKKRKWVGRT